MIHARIKGLLPWGPGPTARKTGLTNVFFFVFVFVVLNLFYTFTEGVQWLFQRKLLFSKVSEGSNFVKGGPIFSREGGGGPNANFYRNPYNL